MDGFKLKISFCIVPRAIHGDFIKYAKACSLLQQVQLL